MAADLEELIDQGFAALIRNCSAVCYVIPESAQIAGVSAGGFRSSDLIAVGTVLALWRSSYRAPVSPSTDRHTRVFLLAIFVSLAFISVVEPAFAKEYNGRRFKE